MDIKKIFLVFLICLQLLIPGYTIVKYMDTYNNGTEYKVAVTAYDPYDPFRGRYLAIRAVDKYSDYYKSYAVIEKDAKGYINIISFEEIEPIGKEYVKDLSIDRYYMNETKAIKADKVGRDLWEDNEVYVIVSVKEGSYVIKGMYINDIPIESFIVSTP